MRFLGEKWGNKNRGKGNGNKINRFAFGLRPGPSTMPQGRGPSVSLFGTAEAVPLSRTGFG
jgi:hypothetical protein